jgi:SAM-dependent methyltransferase
MKQKLPELLRVIEFDIGFIQMSWDPVWESIFSSRPWGRYPAEPLIRFVARHFYDLDRKDIHILELGCGPGANLWFCAREGFSVYGVDGSSSGIEICRCRLDLEVPDWQGELHLGDVTSLPFSSDRFDAIIDNECICCLSWEDAKAAYLEAHRVLRKNGRLFVRTFADGSAGQATGQPAGRNACYCTEGPLRDKGLARFTSRDDIAELLPSELFALDSLEQMQWSVEDMRLWVKEWLIDSICLK